MSVQEKTDPGEPVDGSGGTFAAALQANLMGHAGSELMKLVRYK